MTESAWSEIRQTSRRADRPEEPVRLRAAMRAPVVVVVDLRTPVSRPLC